MQLFLFINIFLKAMQWAINLVQKSPNWLWCTDCQFSCSFYTHFGAFLVPMTQPMSICN